jgi:CheY-like chemotaxis protein
VKAGLLAGLLILTAACARRQETTPGRLILLRFENLSGNPALDWMERGAARQIAAQLKGATSADSQQRQAEREWAIVTGSTRILHGYVSQAGGRLRLNAELERRGHQVTVVSTGRQAVDAVAVQPFDAVLMDVQMPEMDGFEATAAIRRHEQTTGQHVSIIALTAHAMKGDRERCLDAGMDSYVTKPLQAEALYAAIEGRSTVAVTADVRAATNEPPPFDPAALHRQFGDDDALLSEVVGVFVEACPGWQADIRAAIQANDATRLKAVAHTLKGAVSHFGAQPAYDSAHILEQMGRDGQLQNAAAACAALDVALDRLQCALRELCQH